ncbi:unnamed protein product [Lactuca virosa]|uniref:D-isomer specific 2-hydroxyacid dehydrogenase NAD-binding domain-containing protein n=1 Tax=Lactuca virosa TaxID=75947 RepID=A0AAU9LGE8_9ASTR|nr:unnamed protein product [Lactuca virosa]
MEQSSDHMVSDDNFVLRWPENLPLDAGAPLLCAEITTYIPLRYFAPDKPGMKIGVVGLGRLGLLGMLMRRWRKLLVQKLLFSALLLLRTKTYSKDLKLTILLLAKMKNRRSTLDVIIDTVFATHLIAPLLNALKAQGKLVLIGAPEKSLEVVAFSLIMGKYFVFCFKLLKLSNWIKVVELMDFDRGKIVGGRNIGGLKETQEMLDFAAEHRITADVCDTDRLCEQSHGKDFEI